MIHHDSVGQVLTLDSADAVVAWDKTVRGFLAHSAQTPEQLGKCLALAPDFALGWAAKGLFYLLLGRSELVPTAKEALKNARDAKARRNPSAREAAYIGVLESYLAGRLYQAAERIDGILKDHPRDALAMKLGHAIRFIIGDKKGMLHSVANVIDSYEKTHPLLGYTKGCMAFALEEMGEYPLAERFGRAGLELAGDDAWGLHAVAHVYDMNAQTMAGLGWLESQTGAWSHCNNFGYHVWWHLALFYLERRDYDRVLALYDQRIRAEHTDDFRDISNGASMLMRLEIEGIDVAGRWEELAELSAGRVEDGALVFADLHYLMALQSDGRTEQADAMIVRLMNDAARADHDMHEVAALAGVPMALGLAAFRAGKYDLAFERMRAACADMQCIGGSHAQRDVFQRVMIEAGIRARRWGETRQALVVRIRNRGGKEDDFTARRLEAISRLEAAGVAAE